MLTEIKYAARSFDRVIYVTRELTNDNSGIVEGDNTSVIQIRHSDRVKTMIELLFLFFRKEVQSEYWESHRRRNIPPKYLFYIGKELYCSQNLLQVAEPIISSLLKNKKSSIVVQSTWFDASAYSASKLKNMHPEITAVSLAHSFEIDPARGPYVGYSLDRYKLSKLDRVSFIAYGMKRIYLSSLPSWIIPDESKMAVRYLGCTRIFKPLVEKPPHDHVFTLCSCSGINDIKRINLIIEALALWSREKIRWIHIGDGPLMKQLADEAKAKLKNKKNVEYEFVGQLKNYEVQKYYSEHYIDLFINVSISEGLPVSIMEAMSYGIPVIATDVGATREIVSYKENMLLEKDVKAEAIIKAVDSYYNYSGDKKTDMRSRSVKIWEKSFNAELTAKNYYDSLRKNNG